MISTINLFQPNENPPSTMNIWRFLLFLFSLNSLAVTTCLSLTEHGGTDSASKK